MKMLCVVRRGTGGGSAIQDVNISNRKTTMVMATIEMATARLCVCVCIYKHDARGNCGQMEYIYKSDIYTYTRTYRRAHLLHTIDIHRIRDMYTVFCMSSNKRRIFLPYYYITFLVHFNMMIAAKYTHTHTNPAHTYGGRDKNICVK